MKGSSVLLIDQNLLPFKFKIYRSNSYLDTCNAIKTMIIRGAGAIGAATGYAMAQAFLEMPQKNGTAYLFNTKKKIEKEK